jgi:hypothetical protein
MKQTMSFPCRPRRALTRRSQGTRCGQGRAVGGCVATSMLSEFVPAIVGRERACAQWTYDLRGAALPGFNRRGRADG